MNLFFYYLGHLKKFKHTDVRAQRMKVYSRARKYEIIHVSVAVLVARTREFGFATKLLVIFSFFFCLSSKTIAKIPPIVA